MKIDKTRLNELFENKKGKDFNLISKYDKTGKLNKEHDKVLDEFYEIQSEDEDQTKTKFYDKDGKFNWNPESSDEES